MKKPEAIKLLSEICDSLHQDGGTPELRLALVIADACVIASMNGELVAHAALEPIAEATAARARELEAGGGL